MARKLARAACPGAALVAAEAVRTRMPSQGQARNASARFLGRSEQRLESAWMRSAPLNTIAKFGSTPSLSRLLIKPPVFTKLDHARPRPPRFDNSPICRETSHRHRPTPPQ